MIPAVRVGVERDGAKLTIALRSPDKKGVLLELSVCGCSALAAVLSRATCPDASDTSDGYEMTLKGNITFIEGKPA